MNNIVWVIGESAAGKATFIRYAVANPDCELIHQLGYYNKKFISVNESMYFGDYERIIIKDLVLDLLNNETDAAILIKWQATDSLHPEYGNVLRKLASETHDTPTAIVFLSVDSNVLYARLQNKSWWHDPNIPHSYYSREQMDQNVKRARSHAKEIIELGFTFTEIDANNGFRIIENSL